MSSRIDLEWPVDGLIPSLICSFHFEPADPSVGIFKPRCTLKQVKVGDVVLPLAYLMKEQRAQLESDALRAHLDDCQDALDEARIEVYREAALL